MCQDSGERSRALLFLQINQNFQWLLKMQLANHSLDSHMDACWLENIKCYLFEILPKIKFISPLFQKIRSLKCVWGTHFQPFNIRLKPSPLWLIWGGGQGGTQPPLPSPFHPTSLPLSPHFPPPPTPLPSPCQIFPSPCQIFPSPW